METYYALGQLIAVIVIAAQVLFFFIQVWAITKYRRVCFVLLALGAVLGVAYAVVASIPFFVHVGLQSHVLLAKVLVGLVAVGSILGLWGMLLFLRTYHVAQSSALQHSSKT